MRAIQTKTKVPFVVSLTLIFGYSLLMAVVPPSVVSVEQNAYPTAQTPAPEANGDELIRAKAVMTTPGNTGRTVQ